MPVPPRGALAPSSQSPATTEQLEPLARPHTINFASIEKPDTDSGTRWTHSRESNPPLPGTNRNRV